MRKLFCFVAMVVVLLAAAAETWAVEITAYPQRTVTYIMGFPPGGKADIQARGLLPVAEKYLGASLAIQYAPGAGGRLGFTKIFKAKPDGYTIGHLSIPGSILGEFMTTTDYRTRDFTPIFNCFVTPQVLVVAADSYKSIDELIKAGKSRPLTNASSGRGTSSYLAAVVLSGGLGLKEVRHVHCEGTPNALAAVAGRHLDFSVCPTAVAFALVHAGKLRALLTIAEERDQAFPDVPTPRELGYPIMALPGIDGIAGPPHLPVAIQKVLETAFIKAAKDPAFLAWAQKANMPVTVWDHGKFGRVIEEQIKAAEKYRAALLAQ
jgi:tripartite-type tricarboxylate transporter receptor subunit TctC